MRLAYKLLSLAFIILGILGLDFSVFAQSTVTKSFQRPFSQISIIGPVDVQIYPTANGQPPQIVSSSRTFNTVQMIDKNGTLIIAKRTWPDPFSTKAPSITVYAPQGTNLIVGRNSRVTATQMSGPLSLTTRDNATVNLSGQDIDLRLLRNMGDSNINISGINSCSADIINLGAGHLKLEGMLNLNSLVQLGTGSTSLSFVHSKHLVLNLGGKTQLTICGDACVFEANVRGCSTLDAKNLHALRGYIHTCGTSHAEVWVRNTLTAWADDRSNIYYYEDPNFIARYMCPPALVLRMTKICDCSCCRA